jgi:hypothetical protein
MTAEGSGRWLIGKIVEAAEAAGSPLSSDDAAFLAKPMWDLQE